MKTKRILFKNRKSIFFIISFFGLCYCSNDFGNGSLSEFLRKGCRQYVELPNKIFNSPMKQTLVSGGCFAAALLSKWTGNSVPAVFPALIGTKLSCDFFRNQHNTSLKNLFLSGTKLASYIALSMYLQHTQYVKWGWGVGLFGLFDAASTFFLPHYKESNQTSTEVASDSAHKVVGDCESESDQENSEEIEHDPMKKFKEGGEISFEEFFGLSENILKPRTENPNYLKEEKEYYLKHQVPFGGDCFKMLSESTETGMRCVNGQKVFVKRQVHYKVGIEMLCEKVINYYNLQHIKFPNKHIFFTKKNDNTKKFVWVEKEEDITEDLICNVVYEYIEKSDSKITKEQLNELFILFYFIRFDVGKEKGDANFYVNEKGLFIIDAEENEDKFKGRCIKLGRYNLCEEACKYGREVFRDTTNESERLKIIFGNRQIVSVKRKRDIEKKKRKEQFALQHFKEKEKQG